MLTFISNLLGEKKVHIRDAEARDLTILSQIHSASFRQGWSDGDLGKLIANETYTCLIARITASKPIGFILYRTVMDEAEIITIATSPSVRRSGVGRKLLEASIRKLQFGRAKKYFLEVDETNQPAINLYKKHAFQIVGKREGYYASSATGDEKRPAALVMERQLG